MSAHAFRITARCTLVALLAGCAAVPPPAARKVGTVFEITSEAGTGYVMASAHIASHVPIELNADAVAIFEHVDIVAFESLQQQDKIDFAVLLKRNRDTSLLDDVPPDLANRIRYQLERRSAPPQYWTVLQQTRTQFVPLVLGEMIAIRVEDLFGDRMFPALDALARAEAERRSLPQAEVEGSYRALRASLDVSVAEANAATALMLDRLERWDFNGFTDEVRVRALDAVYSGDLEGGYRDFRAIDCPGELLARRCDKVVDERNPHMSDEIEKMVRSGKRPLVILGALHLAGPRSVLRDLEAKGFRVRRIS